MSDPRRLSKKQRDIMRALWLTLPEWDDRHEDPDLRALFDHADYMDEREIDLSSPVSDLELEVLSLRLLAEGLLGKQKIV